jgi:O-antigen/teichoic acid export membrane protein
MIIILTYGMETGFFRFVQTEKVLQKVFSTSIISLFSTSGLFIVLIWIFSGNIAGVLGYESNPEFILWIGIIVGIDAFTAIPFARLRWENKALRFVMIKIAGVIVNIILNFTFLYFIPKTEYPLPAWLDRLYSPSIGVGYVFLSNLAASCFTLVLLSGTLIKIQISFSIRLWLDMMKYSFPLLISGLAGAVNETLDRVLIKHLIPDQTYALEQLGIYGANYKIAVLMTLFVQMFRYASEPFYFGRANDKGAHVLFAAVMKYFVLAALVIFLVVNFYIEIFKYFIGSDFHEGLKIVPIVLFANLLLGIFLNLSIWYKLNNLTKFGAIITLGGACITFLLNWLLIPVYGYIAAAWAHVVCYGSMVLVSWWLGRKHYPIPYQVSRIMVYIIIAVGLFGLAEISNKEEIYYEFIKNTLLLAVFVIIVIAVEKLKFLRQRG